jgi:hypothetical protein
MDSPTERNSRFARFDRRFVRNVFVAAFVGVALGLLVAGASVVSALLVALGAAVVFGLIFAIWGWARESG